MQARLLLRIPWTSLPTQLRFASSCVGCGSHFQNKEPGLPGFQKSPKTTWPQLQDQHAGASVAARDREKWSFLVSKMTSDQQHVLFESASGPSDASFATVLDVKRQKQSVSEQRRQEYCQYCLLNRSGNTSTLTLPPHAADPLCDEPSRTFHIIDAFDFPHGIPSTFAPGDKFVVNRTDLIARHSSQVSKFKQYVMDIAFSKLRLLPRDVICTSAFRGWGLQRLAESLIPGENRFIGRTNSGKTALALALSGQPLDKCWALPFQTQSALKSRTSPKFRSKLIIDTPSLPEPGFDGIGVTAAISPKYRRKVVAGVPLFKNSPRYAGFNICAKPGQVASVGGLVGLQVSDNGGAGSAVHFFTSVPGIGELQGRAFSSIEKLEQINSSDLPQHNNWQITAYDGPLHEITEVELCESHSIVIRGVGIIQPRIFGQWNGPVTAKVWGVPGLEVCVRRNVQPWIFRVPNKSPVVSL